MNHDRLLRAYQFTCTVEPTHTPLHYAAEFVVLVLQRPTNMAQMDAQLRQGYLLCADRAELAPDQETREYWIDVCGQIHIARKWLKRAIEHERAESGALDV